MVEDKPIEYVVNFKTGEAIMTDRTKNLVYHNIAKWNPEHNCFTFDDEYSYILKDNYIDGLSNMLSSPLKVESVFDIILKGKKMKQKVSLEDFIVDGNNRSKKTDNYHYAIVTDNFLLKIYQHHFQFFHKVNGNYIKYKDVKNAVPYQVLRTYIINFFKDSIESILDKGKVGTVKEGILFSNIVEQYKDDRGIVTDTMYIKCKNGLICEIKSNLMNRYYLFYKGRQNPEKQKRIKFPPSGIQFMRSYLEEKVKKNKIKWIN